MPSRIVHSACCAAAAIAIGIELGADTVPAGRVRAADGIATAVLSEGLARSQTFQRLVASISTSEVIVYVTGAGRLSSGVRGTLRFMGTSAIGDRLLRVDLNADAFGGLDTPSALVAAVATLAHELQHALEVAHADHVSDLEAFERFYRQEADELRVDVFDTVAARSAGEQVHFEMTGRRR